MCTHIVLEGPRARRICNEQPRPRERFIETNQRSNRIDRGRDYRNAVEMFYAGALARTLLHIYVMRLNEQRIYILLHGRGDGRCNNLVCQTTPTAISRNVFVYTCNHASIYECVCV